MSPSKKRRKRSDSGLGAKTKRRGERAKAIDPKIHSLVQPTTGNPNKMPSQDISTEKKSPLSSKDTKKSPTPMKKSPQSSQDISTTKKSPTPMKTSKIPPPKKTHHLRSEDVSTSTPLINEPPPSPMEEMYLDYLELMKTAGGSKVGCEMLMKKDTFRPSYVKSFKQLKGYTFPQHIMRRMERGDVMVCQLHKIAFSHKNNKHEIYNSPEHTVPVVFNYAYPEGCLIPFGEATETKTSRGELLGIVPLNKKVQSCWQSVDNDVNLQGFECCMEKSGARYFKFQNQKYFRLGDYQRIDQILEGLDACGGNGNCVVSFSYNCQHQYDLLKNAHKRKNKRIRESKDKIDNKGMCTSVDEATRFTKDVLLAHTIEGSPERIEREKWMCWNVADESADGSRNEEMRRYCLDERETALQFNELVGDQGNHALMNWVKVHFLLAMITSERTRDEMQFRQYLQLTHGCLSPNQIFAPLKHVGFFRYYEHIKKHLTIYSIQQKKAEAILGFIFVLVETYFGEFPESLNKLLAIRYVSSKVAAITLNACGRYKGVGGGADSHVRKCFKYIVLKSYYEATLSLPNPESKLDEVSSRIPEFPGRLAK
mmetsp:Transcript_4269/g.9680  ORF Transcript_4269/g.9680 Transcript_4269/m.9680 type:complete len:595 (+) Transcript_4269:153-1937(+)|eukprot:CAMPEP_0172300734 /NCGR_PEP_ID=MMETSP1058-20130122/2759_1 /TAXON_ID=83371 /ORGANISM="Detonula confervacea, Strain CCMP 353" /LENGTH=594 /DNA_ID=CAMNT_0013010609 /DNA_START=105 /DNA_END=1889 /DNA_ORIENTATION=-